VSSPHRLVWWYCSDNIYPAPAVTAATFLRRFMEYDSTAETLKHIRKVQQNLGKIARSLLNRGEIHDESKLGPEEKPYFDEYTPKLSGLTYGSQEYRDTLKKIKPAIKHHQENNSHHPEHYKDGIDGMNLMDVIEMLCDWKAATERHNDGDIQQSFEVNRDRFKISQQLESILKNTVLRLGW